VNNLDKVLLRFCRDLMVKFEDELEKGCVGGEIQKGEGEAG
jgi:hypothetical protein